MALEVYDLHSIHLTRTDVDEYIGSFTTLSDASTESEQELLSRLNNEAQLDLRRRESLEQHNQLFYQLSKPSSYAAFGSKIWNDPTSYVNLGFFSYKYDGLRKLVLDEVTYNNMIALSQQGDPHMLIETQGILENAIVYSVEKDLSITPLVYGNQIKFESPEKVREEYGEI